MSSEYVRMNDVERLNNLRNDAMNRAEEKKKAEQLRQEESKKKDEELVQLKAQLAAQKEIAEKDQEIARLRLELAQKNEMSHQYLNHDRGSRLDHSQQQNQRQEQRQQQQRMQQVDYPGGDGSGNSSELSTASCGRRMIKSEHGTHMRVYDREWKVDLMHGEPGEWEHWYIEDWRTKVVFKAIHSPGRFLRACSNGNVDLVGSNPNDCPETFWKSFKNSDKTWSFQSVHGTWLSGLGNNVVCCKPECKSSEKFTLPWW